MLINDEDEIVHEHIPLDGKLRRNSDIKPAINRVETKESFQSSSSLSPKTAKKLTYTKGKSGSYGSDW